MDRIRHGNRRSPLREGGGNGVEAEYSVKSRSGIDASTWESCLVNAVERHGSMTVVRIHGGPR